MAAVTPFLVESEKVRDEGEEGERVDDHVDQISDC